MEMLCDNEPAIAIAVDPGILKGARHFQRKYHYIREVIQECKIVLKKVHTDDNLVDPFTKPMSFNKHYKHVMAIGVVPANTYMVEHYDNNITHGSSDMSNNGGEADQDEQKFQEERALLASFIENMKCEIDESKQMNKHEIV
ncbi:hypothetical protein Tco_1075504 [Tanacetum coccineum]